MRIESYQVAHLTFVDHTFTLLRTVLGKHTPINFPYRSSAVSGLFTDALCFDILVGKLDGGVSTGIMFQ